MLEIDPWPQYGADWSAAAHYGAQHPGGTPWLDLTLNERARWAAAAKVAVAAARSLLEGLTNRQYPETSGDPWPVRTRLQGESFYYSAPAIGAARGDIQA